MIASPPHPLPLTSTREFHYDTLLAKINHELKSRSKEKSIKFEQDD